MVSECEFRIDDPLPSEQALMVHVIESVGAVLLRLADILSPYPYRGRVVVRKAEKFALFE